MLSARTAAQFANAVYAFREGPIDARVAFGGEANAGIADNYDLSKGARLIGRSGLGAGAASGFGFLVPRKGQAHQGEYVLALRGTDTTADWLSNAKVGLTMGPGGHPVHMGFNQIYKSIRGQLQTQLRGKTVTKLDIVGHSLGGALSSLFAMDYGSRREAAVTLATFGAPRVGNAGFARDLKSVLSSDGFRRVYAISDPVPMIPLFPFFHAVGGATAINAGFSSVDGAAHSMDQVYLKEMSAAGSWPPMRDDPTRGDVAFWIKQANLTGHPFSVAGLASLSKALVVLLSKIMGLSVAVVLQSIAGGVVTVLDSLAYIIHQGVRISKEIAEEVAEFLYAVLGWLGRAAAYATRGLAEITVWLIRGILAMLFNTLASAARIALRRLPRV